MSREEEEVEGIPILRKLYPWKMIVKKEIFKRKRITIVLMDFPSGILLSSLIFSNTIL